MKVPFTKERVLQVLILSKTHDKQFLETGGGVLAGCDDGFNKANTLECHRTDREIMVKVKLPTR